MVIILKFVGLADAILFFSTIKMTKAPEGAYSQYQLACHRFSWTDYTGRTLA